MGLFTLFGKKKEPAQESLDLPPPPAPDAPMPATDVRIIEEPPSFDRPVEEEPAQAEPVPEPETMPLMQEEPEEQEIEPAPRMRGAPMFVSVNDYQEVLGSIGYIRNKLADADELVKKLNELKMSEEKSFEQWRGQLEDLQRKLAYVEDVVAAA